MFFLRMNKKEIAENERKVNSGNYIVMFKLKNVDRWDVCTRPKDLSWRYDFDYRFIHKKDEKILNAFILDNKTLILYKLEHDAFLGLETDFINNYDENKNYILDYKEKNMSQIEHFAQYGFEAPVFEAEILKKVGDCFIGYVIIDDVVHSIKWFVNGMPSLDAFMNYSLKPLKKEEMTEFEIVKEEKVEENIFAKFGFETPKNPDLIIGYLYKDRYGVLRGHELNNNTLICWDEKGRCLTHPDSNLTPLKTKCYDDENDFPCFMYYKNKMNISFFEFVKNRDEAIEFEKRGYVRISVEEILIVLSNINYTDSILL